MFESEGEEEEKERSRSTEAQKHRSTVGKMGGWMGGWMDGWMGWQAGSKKKNNNWQFDSIASLRLPTYIPT